MILYLIISFTCIPALRLLTHTAVEIDRPSKLSYSSYGKRVFKVTDPHLICRNCLYSFDCSRQDLQKSYDAPSSIYWLESGSPFFNEPNIATPLIHYDQYWDWQSGDYLKLMPGSEATLLAGMYQNRDGDYGVIASCFDGRVILQTFCNHDYHEADIQLLWENYISNTLESRFAALDE